MWTRHVITNKSSENLNKSRMSSNLVLLEKKRNVDPKSAVLRCESASFIRVNGRCLTSLISSVNAVVCKISQ